MDNEAGFEFTDRIFYIPSQTSGNIALENTFGENNPDNPWLHYDNDIVYFEKADYADWTLAENQDRISEEVWLTRGNYGWLFNAYYEEGHSYESPSNTLWAFGPTGDQESENNYDYLKPVVDDYLGGFRYTPGNTFSLYLEDQMSIMI